MKRGYIVSEDTPVDPGQAQIRRFVLQNGTRVYLPRPLASWLIDQHSPAEEFFFLERGVLGRTEWAGNLHELRLALKDRLLTEKDLAGFRLPALESIPGWNPPRDEDDHAYVGQKLGALQATMAAQGMVDTAAQLSVDLWLKDAGGEGVCLSVRTDTSHERVWCEMGRGHAGNHSPTCPACANVKFIMGMMARDTGHWRS